MKTAQTTVIRCLGYSISRWFFFNSFFLLTNVL
jgi:hypothetical protein